MRDAREVAGVERLTALDRAAQILPVPLGTLAPVRQRSFQHARLWRRRRSILVASFGLLAIALSVWVWTSPTSFNVEETAGTIYVDNLILSPRAGHYLGGVRVFVGSAALALSTMKAGTMTGGAVMTWGGVVTSGRCVMHSAAQPISEMCDFTSGSGDLASTDMFDPAASVWRRHYGDGEDVTITVPSGSALIPIPFPLGR